MKTILSSTSQIAAMKNDLTVMFALSSETSRKNWLRIIERDYPGLYNESPESFKQNCWGLSGWLKRLDRSSVAKLLAAMTEASNKNALREVASSLRSDVTKPIRVLAAAEDAGSWFFDMSVQEQKDYVEDHPHSKYAGHIGKTKDEHEKETEVDPDAGTNKVKARRIKSRKIANLTSTKEKLEADIEKFSAKAEKTSDTLTKLHGKMKAKSGGKPGIIKRILHRFSSQIRALKTQHQAAKEDLKEARIKYKAVVKQIKLIKRGKA